MDMDCGLSAASRPEDGPWEPPSILEYWLDSSCAGNHSPRELRKILFCGTPSSPLFLAVCPLPLLTCSPRKDVFSKVFFFPLKLSGRMFLRCDFNLEFSLVGRSHLGWKEGLGDRGSWALGSGPAVPFPEKGVHDNEFPVGSTSAPRQGRSHLRLCSLENLY